MSVCVNIASWLIKHLQIYSTAHNGNFNAIYRHFLEKLIIIIEPTIAYTEI